MSLPRRVFLAGGLLLALWGMAYGLWYAVFAEHQALDGIGASLSNAFASAAQRQTESVGNALEQYRATKFIYDRQVDVHSHWIGLAMVLIVLGIGLDRLRFSERIKLILSIGAFLGAVLFPLAVLLQTFDHGSVPRMLAVVGSGLVIGSLAAFAIGFAQDRPDRQ
jgi:hypothetical protein